jgi:hypothetical protein
MIAHEVEFFDRLVSLDTLLDEPARRRSSRAVPPLSHYGRRYYTFVLAAQPEAEPARHSAVITVAVARAGLLTRSTERAPQRSNLGGPNGGFADATLQTSDGRYDLRVSEGTLLPSGERPSLRVERAVSELARRYEEALRARKTAQCK